MKNFRTKNSWGAMLIAILFSGNIFWLHRLIDKIDTLELSVWDLRQQVTILRVTIEGMGRFNSDKIIPKSGAPQNIAKL